MSKRDTATEPKKPGRKPADFTFDLKVEFVPVREDQMAQYKAGIRLLLSWLHEIKDEHEKEIQETLQKDLLHKE